MIVFHPEQIHSLIASAAIIGAKTAMEVMGGCKDMMIQKEAYAKYGNKTVKKWHKAGLLHPKRVENWGSKYIMYPVIELIVASQSEIASRLTPNASGEIVAWLNEDAKSGCR